MGGFEGRKGKGEMILKHSLKNKQKNEEEKKESSKSKMAEEGTVGHSNKLTSMLHVVTYQ